MKNKVMGNVEPKCEYCLYGTLSPNGANVLCPKKGVLAKDYNCKNYKYDPLKRIPRKLPRMQEFTAEDFEL